MWRRLKNRDVVAASLKETQVARQIITESGLLLNDIEGELMQILSGSARSDIVALKKLIARVEPRN